MVVQPTRKTSVIFVNNLLSNVKIKRKKVKAKCNVVEVEEEKK